MNTIREYIADAIWWLSYQLDKLARWIQPPYNPENNNFVMYTKEDKDEKWKMFNDLMNQ